VLTGRVLCIGPITQPEDSYRVYVYHWVGPSATVTHYIPQWVCRRGKTKKERLERKKKERTSTVCYYRTKSFAVLICVIMLIRKCLLKIIVEKSRNWGITSLKAG